MRMYKYNLWNNLLADTALRRLEAGSREERTEMIETVLQRFTPYGLKTWEGLVNYRAEYKNGTQGLLNPEDMDALFNAAIPVPPGGIIVEIGSFKGTSTVHLGAAAKLVGARVYAIDPFRQNKGGEDLRYPRYFEEFMATIQKCGVEDVVTPIADYSQRVSHLFKDGSIDLLFIDGDHSAEGVKRDYDLYAPKVKPGGTILFHDATYGPVATFLKTLAAEPVTELIAKVRKP